jgi:hypothetical protein
MDLPKSIAGAAMKAFEPIHAWAVIEPCGKLEGIFPGERSSQLAMLEQAFKADWSVLKPKELVAGVSQEKEQS